MGQQSRAAKRNDLVRVAGLEKDISSSFLNGYTKGKITFVKVRERNIVVIKTCNDESQDGKII